VTYALGRVFGARLLEQRWFCRLAPPSKREKVRANFHRYGVLILVFGRLVPGIRTTLFLTAGLMRLSVARFCLADGIGAIIGNSVLFLLGYVLGHQFQDLVQSLEDKMRSSAKPIIVLALAVAVLGYILYRTLRKPIPTGGPEEMPIIGPSVASRLPKKTPPDPCAEENPAIAVADAVLPGGSDDAKEARGTQSPTHPG
jgi:membrane protein YqaA with SNARE-associated domain